jgi:iron complex transport system ATP-binding protein
MSGLAGAREVLRLDGVGLVRDGRTVLDGVDWSVGADERWVVLGRNGTGKTTLIRVASLYLHPTRGEVTVLGERLGRTDVRTLRRRVGLASAGLADALRPGIAARDVVATARYAALEPWWHEYTAADHERAGRLLADLGVGALAGQAFGTLSSGERQRVLLARTLMAEPELLLLDEPTAGLDLGGREELVSSLGELAADPATPATVLVTHHVEEIPAGYTHALLLAGHGVLLAGPLDEVVTAEHLSTCFGLALSLRRDPASGRFGAQRA